MILRGILGRVLDNFICVRGFAKLGDLEEMSFADATFQRNVIQPHLEDITAFLKARESLFFPEVVLSCQLKRTDAQGQPEFIPPGLLNNDLFDIKPLNEKFDGITIKSKLASKYKSEGDIRVVEHFNLVEIRIDDDYWSHNQNKPFFRIDGNHRLSAGKGTPELSHYSTPFCILLFDDYNENNRHSKVIFHNINSKAIPLTSEENLRVILKSEDLFPDDVLKIRPYFGWAYYFTRQLIKRINFNDGQFSQLPHLHALSNEPFSTLLMLFKFLIEEMNILKEDEAQIGLLFRTLKKIDTFYEHENRLQNNKCKGLLVAFVYYQLASSTKLSDVFKNWILSSNLYEIEEVEARSLIKIFDKIMQSRSRTIFVSMQFSADVEVHYEMIKTAVTEINTEFKFDIKLQQLRIDEFSLGHSYQISDKILGLIEDSGLLIADLTHPNTNVYHEVGFLMGVNQGKNLKQENFILVMRNQRDADNDKRVGFNLRGWQQLRFDETHELKELIKVSIKKYYQLI